MDCRGKGASLVFGGPPIKGGLVKILVSVSGVPPGVSPGLPRKCWKHSMSYCTVSDYTIVT